MEFTLLGGALIGVLAFYGALQFMGRRDPATCVKDLWEIGLAAILAGLVVGRLVAMIRQGANPISFDFMLIRAGVDTIGATLGALGAVAYLARGSERSLIGYLAAPALAGLAGWHAGCLVRETCLGVPSDVPWAWAAEGGTVTRHPVELYAALLLIGAGLIAYRLRRKPMVAAAFGVAAAAGVRLAVFPLQTTLSTTIVWWYGGAALVGLAAAFYTARPLSEWRNW